MPEIPEIQPLNDIAEDCISLEKAELAALQAVVRSRALLEQAQGSLAVNDVRHPALVRTLTKLTATVGQALESMKIAQAKLEAQLDSSRAMNKRLTELQSPQKLR
jgi:glutamine synthetase type III